MNRVDASTASSSSEFALETEGRLPMAGGRPVAYLTAWRPAETSTATTIDQVSPSPTGTEAAKPLR